MTDDEINLPNENYLRFLNIFRRRTLKMITFDKQKYKQLYYFLTCRICMQLFQQPIRLNCSHRFCKGCIQEYIKINNNKVLCPSCLEDITEVKDLKIDQQMVGLVQNSFSNPAYFNKELNEIENAQTSVLHYKVGQTSKFKEQKKGGRKKVKLNTSEIFETIETNKLKRKKKSQSTKIKEEWEKKISVLLRIQTDLEDLEGVTSDKKKQQPLKDLCEQQIAAKTKRTQNRTKNITRDEKQQTQAKQVVQRVSKPFKEITQEQNNQSPQFIEPRKSYAKEKQILKAQFGNDYLFAILRIPIVQTLFQVFLKRKNGSFLTPQLPFVSVKLSSKTTIQTLYKLISRMLSISEKNLYLYTENQSDFKLQSLEECKSMNLIQLNQQRWRNLRNIEFASRKELLVRNQLNYKSTVSSAFGSVFGCKVEKTNKKQKSQKIIDNQCHKARQSIKPSTIISTRNLLEKQRQFQRTILYELKYI